MGGSTGYLIADSIILQIRRDVRQDGVFDVSFDISSR